MLVLGGSYHCGFNFGLNIAEAINYGTLNWLNQLPLSKICHCLRSSVKAEPTEILKNLEQCILAFNLAEFNKTKEFLKFKSYVYGLVEKEEEEEEKAQEEVGVKLEFSKKIKKQKKEPKKLKYKGDDYEVENWAQCDKCHIWRKLGRTIKVEGSFRCRDVNKNCNKKDRVDKSEHYIVL